jgi:hypothetical protein
MKTEQMEVPKGFVLLLDAVSKTGISEQTIRNNIKKGRVDNAYINNRRFVNLEDVMGIKTMCPRGLFTTELAFEWEQVCRRFRA